MAWTLLLLVAELERIEEVTMGFLRGLRQWMAAASPSRFYCRRANRITDRCAAEEEGVVCPCAAECAMSPVRLAFAVARRGLPDAAGPILKINRR